MSEMDLREWWEVLRQEMNQAQQGRRRATQTDFYAGANFGFNTYYVPFDDPFEPEVTSADHAFELFVRGELSEERYLHWVKFYMGKQLTPEQERLERIRNKPKIKQQFTRLKPWE